MTSSARRACANTPGPAAADRRLVEGVVAEAAGAARCSCEMVLHSCTWILPSPLSIKRGKILYRKADLQLKTILKQ